MQLSEKVDDNQLGVRTGGQFCAVNLTGKWIANSLIV